MRRKSGPKPTKKERKKNAEQFYNMFMSGCCNKTAIVAQKCVSTNPNINKVQFMAVPSPLSYGTPVIIAESNFGLTGCFAELLKNIHPEIMQEKSYFDDGFNEWLEENYHFRITYKDGFVFFLERD